MVATTATATTAAAAPTDQTPVDARALAAAPTVWQIDPSHSSVEFAIKHLMFSTVKGHFTGLAGQILAPGDDPRQGTVEVTIDAASIDTRDEKRDAHLRSADFFDAETFPTLRFVADRVEPVGGDRFRLHGDLTIRDVTKPIALDATFNGRGTTPWGHEVAGYTARAAINRKDYGLTWSAPLESGGVLVGDDVAITIELEAAKQS